MKIILFDLDGTIQDSEQLAARANCYGFEAVLGREPTAAELEQLTGAPLPKVLAAWFPERHEELFGKILEYYELNPARPEVYEGISELLNRLRGSGYRMGIVSSKKRPYILEEIAFHGLRHLFEVVVGQEDTLLHKPHPEPLLLAAAELQVSPAECIYIGDQPTDMLAARQAGMTAVAALWGEGERERIGPTSPTFQLEKPADLLAYVNAGAIRAPRYFLTDLDGTLLRSDATLSDYTIGAITDALNDGAVISYATARSYTSASGIVSAIPWKYPVVLYNGALVYDPVGRKVVDGFWLESEMASSIIEIGRAFLLAPLLFCLNEEDRELVLHEKLTRYGDMKFYNSRPGDPRFREVERLHAPVSARTLMITYIGRLDELEPLRDKVAEAFGEQMHINMMPDGYIEEHYFLEFSHAKANKREGLLLWARLVGCAAQDVTVFGDNLNDIGLFADAGTRIAVASAHPHIAAMADRIVGTNNEDGVAAFIAGSLRDSGHSYRAERTSLPNSNFSE